MRNARGETRDRVPAPPKAEWLRKLPPTREVLFSAVSRTACRRGAAEDGLWRVATRGGRSDGWYSDKGIDGIINEDRLGLDVIYLQAKKWEGTVGRPEIQKFVRGALHGKRAKKGIFMTTGAFSFEAAQYVATIDPKVVLIDGEQLAEIMIDFNVGVSPMASYEIKRIDSDYFGEE